MQVTRRHPERSAASFDCVTPLAQRYSAQDARRAVEGAAFIDRASCDKGLDFGLVGPHPAGSECAFEVHAFAYFDGPIEDPVTGSLNAGIAQWLIGKGLAPERYVAAQGTALGRAGRIHVAKDADGRVWIGGRSHTVISGHVTL